MKQKGSEAEEDIKEEDEAEEEDILTRAHIQGHTNNISSLLQGQADNSTCIEELRT